MPMAFLATFSVAIIGPTGDEVAAEVAEAGEPEREKTAALVESEFGSD